MEQFEIVIKMKSGNTHTFITNKDNICDSIIDKMNIGSEFISIEGHLIINLDELESVESIPMLVVKKS